MNNCEMGIPQKFWLTFWKDSYLRSFTNGFGVVVRDLGEWRPGFYSEFRYASREHSGLAWEVFFDKKCQLSVNPHFLKMDMSKISRNRHFPKKKPRSMRQT